MSDFRTSVRVPSSGYKIGLNHRITTVGSCFSDAMGAHLERNKFSVSINPFGVIYNPVSIHRALEYAITDQIPDDQTYLQSEDVHLNYDLHSSLAALEKTQLENMVRKRITDSHQQLKNSRWLLITYGTSWVFSLRSSGRIVANCHKQPSKLFEKSLLPAEQITKTFEEMHKMLKMLNPGIKIILTVSPVRHIKDTLQLNSVSKSILRAACHTLSESYSDVEYFPAFEIMLDDLRDYRFYKSDMIHPSEQAEDYIWTKFMDCYMDSNCLDFISQWKSIYPALLHRPFHPQSSGHQIFLRQTLHKLEQLQGVNVDREIESIRTQLLDSQNTNQSSL